jgi:hypothetical protein
MTAPTTTIVHELAHVHVPRHTPDFWPRVERALPTFQAATSELARVGRACGSAMSHQSESQRKTQIGAVEWV